MANKILWQGHRGYKVWRLGVKTDRSAKPDGISTQAIDHVWDDSGDHTGHISHCDHADKILIHGEDCTEVASFIVSALNAADISQPPRPVSELLISKGPNF